MKNYLEWVKIAMGNRDYTKMGRGLNNFLRGFRYRADRES